MMEHIPKFESFKYNELLINDTYEILEGKVSQEDLAEILNEGIFSFIKGIFSSPVKKRKLNKLGEELFLTKVELQKLEIEEDQVDKFRAELNPRSNDYRAADQKLKIADKAKETKIQALRDREENILSQMDSIGQESDILQKYVNKVKLEIRMRANDATIKLADAEVARVLKQLQKKDAKQVKSLDMEISKAV